MVCWPSVVLGAWGTTRPTNYSTVFHEETGLLAWPPKAARLTNQYIHEQMWFGGLMVPQASKKTLGQTNITGSLCFHGCGALVLLFVYGLASAHSCRTKPLIADIVSSCLCDRALVDRTRSR